MDVDHARGGAPLLQSLNDLTTQDGRVELLSVISASIDVDVATLKPLENSVRLRGVTPRVLLAARGDHVAAQKILTNLETDVGNEMWWDAVQILLKQFFRDGAY
jgi:hypothetical protein